MNHSVNLVVSGVTLLLLLSGCSSSALYASGQAWQQQACNKLQDRTERERCMASTRLSYPDYQRQKEAAHTGQ